MAVTERHGWRISRGFLEVMDRAKDAPSHKVGQLPAQWFQARTESPQNFRIQDTGRSVSKTVVFETTLLSCRRRR
jgi:hypothetical protein